MRMDVEIMNESDRSQLKFVPQVRATFSFLIAEGFAEVEALPTLVRYRKNDVEVDVYHGRQSYEIGGGITVFGSRYAMSEVIRSVDPDTAKSYRNAVATTAEGITVGLEQLSALMQRYGMAVIRGDSEFFLRLDDQRKRWAEEYALDVLAGQLRPQADESFRRGEYKKAAELYGRIRKRLSRSELKKLALAEERCKR